ncbi:hypothetical protein KTR66_04580 [Roseococcus sp. SDR]|uniref:phage regulatory CII family protein n=1 Tax=Roseococcus sp. SDR TaxID=2835532 RepID=UPI001BCE4046|nr:phage regulatory CII family protein [Roseococcus sp. SDR]MBS7789255.1 hypothetical protein [Roseococcus sp. SDR]MBV1844569.1 hypothetical protein [Roseococcus sp. SDR]
MRVKHSQLANYYDMKCDQFVPVDVVADLEAVLGEPLVTADLARRAGCILLPVPSEGDGLLARHIARLADEASHVFSAYGHAIANDGKVDPSEAEKLERELADVVRVGTAALAHLRAARR